jgi:rhamnosyltransferase
MEAGMSDTLVSIIVRSFNEGWALDDTLAAIQAQEYRPWELLVFDSGSSDGSLEIARRAQPRALRQLQPEEYVPGRVLNQAMRLARSPYCVFLNADATPQNTHWLRPLVQALADTRTAAAFSRQVPRPDCRAVYACDYERCFGPGREAGQWDHFFSMVSSAVRRDIWAERGFREDLQYAEDDEYTRWAKGRGYRVVYVPDSVVMHSHNYTPAQAYRRSFGDALALAASWPGQATAFSWFRTVLLGWINDVRRDALFCAGRGRWREWPHAARIRWSQRRGVLEGFRQGWTVYRESTG